MQYVYPPGATPLDPDECAGLLPSHIVRQSELNAWEQLNIVQGEQWALRQKKRALLTEGFIRDLHRRMFDQTWRWAGTFRCSNKNIGVDWTQIAVCLRNLLDNTQYQIEHGVFAPFELAVRFHHRLVWIHPFPNGNGRHARLMADLLLIRLGKPRMTWGKGLTNLTAPDQIRKQYLAALRNADQGEFDSLINFASS